MKRTNDNVKLRMEFNLKLDGDTNLQIRVHKIFGEIVIDFRFTTVSRGETFIYLFLVIGMLKTLMCMHVIVDRLLVIRELSFGLSQMIKVLASSESRGYG